MAKTGMERLEAIHIGCAGWSIPKESVDCFPAEGSHLERYAARFPAVEINSSFYRPHKPETYSRWAASVPENFRFSVKVPKAVTHHRRLVDVDELLNSFLAEATQLGDKLGPLLVQLPASLKYSAEIAENFFNALRIRYDGLVAFEPRHKSWFTSSVEGMISGYRIGRVAADPAVVPEASIPSGWDGLVYYRLHGTPRIYYSAYSNAYLETLAETLIHSSTASRIWCIFDNTALGAATVNALAVQDQLSRNLDFVNRSS